jgi:pimeloyl-ACP methyl ester carboxylesterase
MVNDADCDKTKRPIVLVHGTAGSGTNFNHPALLFASNGYCADRIRAIEYNSVSLTETGAAYAQAEAEIDKVIEQLKQETGFDKVDLAGHSQGSGHGSMYASTHPDKVAHYVHLAGRELTEDPGGVPTLCLSSTGDRPVNCMTTANFTHDDMTLDHFAVAASTASFVEWYKFLNDGQEPKYTEIQCGDPITIEGRVVAFGDNERIAGGRVEVYALGDAPRERGEPVATLDVAEDGSVGPWQATRGVAYEFKAIGKPGDNRKPRFYYFTPWRRSDRLVRFLFESNDPVPHMTTDKAMLSDDHAVLIAQGKRGAWLFGRDSLLVDDQDAINADDAMQGKVVVGLYVLDNDGDKQSEFGSSFSSIFVNATDIYLPTETPKFIEVKFGDQVMQVPNWPSASVGISMLMFD